MPIDQVQTYYPEYAQNQALINDLKTDIDGGMPEVSIQQYYPELYAKATDTTKDTGIGTMGKASLNSPLDM